MGEPRVYTTCKMRHGRTDLRYAPAGSRVRRCQCPGLECAHPDAASLIVGGVTIREAAAARTLELVAEWLRAEALAARKSGSLTGPEWCDALRSAAGKVERGEPLRWAEERGRG